jgi:trypsin-like peptidase
MKPKQLKWAGALAAAAFFAVALLAYAGVQGSGSGTDGSAGGTSAKQALEVQADVQRANLPTRLEAALGSAFAGVWYDSATPMLHVGVISPASRAAAAAVAAGAGLAPEVAETRVRSTMAQLEATQERMGRRLGDLFAKAAVVTRLAPQLNAVEVELSPSVPSTRRVALEREAAREAVHIAITTAASPGLRLEPDGSCATFVSGAANCASPIVAGVTIEPENAAGTCTAGPLVLPENRAKPAAATETYLLTAGHCIEAGGKAGATWYAYNTEKKPEKKPIGAALEYLESEADVGVIKVNNPGYWAKTGFVPAPAEFAYWETPPSEVQVVSEKAVAVNNQDCFSGQVSGLVCGKITAINQKAMGKKGVFTGLAITNMFAQPGDSGAPVFSQAFPSQVEGVLVGEIGGFMAFQTLSDSFSKLKTKFELLTSSNEERHPQKFRSELAETAVTSTADGTGKTAHHVIEAGGATLTCASASFEGTQTGTAARELALAATYKECTYGGVATTVSMGGCGYVFHSSGEFDISSRTGKSCATEPMKWEAGKCKIEVLPSFAHELLTFNTIKPGTVNEVTTGINVTGITYKATGEGCAKKGEFSNGAYTTGNTILTGAKTGGGAMVNYRWE